MEQVKIRAPRPSNLRWDAIGVNPEIRIAAEVAFQLRISPKYSDDGAPEGTCERPISVRAAEKRKPARHEEEDELDLRSLGS
jgi:hypothetical protein